MNTKLLTGTLIVAVSLALGAPALAGETTGNGGETPIKSQQSFPDAPAGPANSFCAFSGLNDVPDGSDSPGDPFAPGRVQSFGDSVQQVVRTFPGNPSDYVDLLLANKPGIFCKGFPRERRVRLTSALQDGSRFRRAEAALSLVAGAVSASAA